MNHELTEALRGLKSNLDNSFDKKLINFAKSGKVHQNDPIEDLITNNFNKIKDVVSKKRVTLDNISVKDMTLGGNLTGDQPRTYGEPSFMPGQALNFQDLVRSVIIEGGTYTFPKETGKTGAPGIPVEAAEKASVDYDLEMVDVSTDFIAGYTRYSRKMANNLPFLQSFLPDALRRDYWTAENAEFYTILAAATTASSEVITGQNKIEMLVAELANLEAANYVPTAMVVTPSDFWDIMVTEKSTGAGYGLPGVVTYESNQLRINGVPVYRATWMAADKYFVGDFSRMKKVITSTLNVMFSEEDSDNFVKNNLTARVEAQVALAIERPDSVIFGDFTAI